MSASNLDSLINDEKEAITKHEEEISRKYKVIEGIKKKSKQKIF